MNANDPDGRSSPGTIFSTTHWSMVLAAGHRSTPSGNAALEHLCCTYWYPLYAFIRRRGGTAQDAQDCTQEFFAQLLQRGDLATVQPQKGKFRSFLLASVQHYMANQRKAAGRQKRGGGKLPLSIDQTAGEQRYAAEPAHDLSPDKLFERRWALTLLEESLGELQKEYTGADKQVLFDRLKVFLTGGDDGPAYGTLAADLDMSEAAIKMAVSRLRRRYRDILRTQIAHTVASPEDIEDEIRHLFAALG